MICVQQLFFFSKVPLPKQPHAQSLLPFSKDFGVDLYVREACALEMLNRRLWLPGATREKNGALEDQPEPAMLVF